MSYILTVQQKLQRMIIKLIGDFYIVDLSARGISFDPDRYIYNASRSIMLHFVFCLFVNFVYV